MTRRFVACSVALLLSVTLASCATARAARSEGGRLRIVAAENTWGDLAAHVGGALVSVHSVIDSPDADPHDYEPTADDGVAFADADLVIVNGLGYDAWAGKLAKADHVRGDHLLDVGEVTGHRLGDNPHRWYSPDDVEVVIDAIVAKLSALHPGLRAQFEANAAGYRAGDFARYRSAVAAVRRFSGTPIGASESIVVPLADDTGLTVRTPAPFLDAISEGTEPTVADKKTCDQLIRRRAIAVYLFNEQNATPDVRAQVRLARANGIPVVELTETPTPEGATFVDWQVRQLTDLMQALEAHR